MNDKMLTLLNELIARIHDFSCVFICFKHSTKSMVRMLRPVWRLKVNRSLFDSCVSALRYETYIHPYIRTHIYANVRSDTKRMAMFCLAAMRCILCLQDNEWTLNRLSRTHIVMIFKTTIFILSNQNSGLVLGDFHLWICFTTMILKSIGIF